MTIATTLNRIEYTATASQTVFPYTFLIFLNTDLEVYQEGTLLTLTTDYTVSGLGDITGGNVTLVTGAPVNDAIIIVRVLPLTQLTDYVENDPFPADTHEKALDRATMVSQQLLETLGRAIKLPITSTLEDIDIPVPGGGKHLAWNSGGTALELVTVSEAAIASPVSTEGDIIQGDSSGDAERLAVGATGQRLEVVAGKAAWVAPGGLLKSIQVFTSSGTWTKPTGIIRVVAQVVGGGGGGARGTAALEGSGGGGGGMAIELLDVTGTASETVTVGAGGAAEASGGGGSNAGATSSFGSLLSATGGGGGNDADGSAGGAGGAGSGGDVNLVGARGLRSQEGLSGGHGGSSSVGGGGGSGYNSVGLDGENYGGGGGGGDGVFASGAGAGGIVIVWEYD